ncbi:hypothetical protein QOZ80_8BG0655630 [Eleusine coracana subsp. coracana]|nr:hypothetical protein QOZ80_8BG0655630 [Eleusine coracana subsp. coracana]
MDVLKLPRPSLTSPSSRTLRIEGFLPQLRRTDLEAFLRVASTLRSCHQSSPTWSVSGRRQNSPPRRRDPSSGHPLSSPAAYTAVSLRRPLTSGIKAVFCSGDHVVKFCAWPSTAGWLANATPRNCRTSPSPQPRRPRHRPGGRDVIIKRVVKTSTAGIVFPMLSRINYTEWSLVMQVNLQAAVLWDAIEFGAEDYREDRSALAALLRAVPQDMQAGLARKASAAEAWEAIHTVRVGVERVKEANAEKLHRDFGDLQFKSGGCVEDFALRATTLANQLWVLRDPITDREVVKKILHSVADHLEQVAISIETLLDLDSISVEEATGRLRAMEQRKKKPQSSTLDSNGRLLLTEEEWMSRLKIREGEASRGGSGSGGHGGKGRGRGRGRGRGSGHSVPRDGRDDRPRRAGPGDQCQACGKMGHWAKDCRSKGKKQVKAHVAEEEEGSLLLAEVFESCVSAAAPPPPPPPQRAVVHLLEEKVFSQLGQEEDRDAKRWVVDTGATNHMTGSWDAFSALDVGVCGTVKFGDGSVVRIEGCGSLLLKCKNGEHRLFTGVYFIPRLKINIISIGQLDEVGFQTLIEDGVMQIRDADRRLLAKIPRAPNQLYVLSATIAQSVDQLCDGCLAGKQPRIPFPEKAEFRSSRVLELVHGDLCGPISPPTPSDQAADAIKRVRAEVEATSGQKLSSLRTDRGGEFTSAAFSNYCSETGVRCQLTAPYSPQQNGVVERWNQSVVAAARSMLRVKNLPSYFWGEAVSTAVYLLNRSPTKSVEGMTPFQPWSTKMIFMGYEPGSKAYRTYNPRTGRVHITRDVVFDEGAQWDWTKDDGVHGNDTAEPLVIEYITSTEYMVEPGGEQAEPRTPSPAAPDGRTPLPTPPPVEFVSPPSRTPDLDIEHDDAEEPGSLVEAAQEPSWRAAMVDELCSIEDNNTWVAADLPPGHRPIGLKWVYKAKKDEQGRVVKHKARLVAKGFVQRQGIDFEEVFAPVARMESVRMILTVAVHEDWRVHHMDVKSAFLNGELEEEVYVRQPLGFIVGKENQVLKLKKALYGLWQAPRAWYSKLHSSLSELGFTRSDHEHAVYTQRTASRPLVIGVYIDDLLIAGVVDSDIDGFKQQMRERFRMSDLGLLSYYLGIEVRQNTSGITLCQSAYAQKLLERTGMSECNASLTPMEPRIQLVKNSAQATVDGTEYRSVVGALRYLLHTRPDVAHAVNYVSRFMAEPHQDHQTAVKHILRYIAGTRDLRVQYTRDKAGELLLQGYSDSDLAGDIEDSRSTSGILFYLGRSPILW